MIDCACGCGTKIWNIDDHGRPRKYTDHHFKKYSRILIDCACGCGTKIWNIDDHGRPRKYVSGHNSRGKLREQTSAWKGGRAKNNGYQLIRKPDHPHADSYGYVREHRLVYEESRNCCIIPRLLGLRVIVHHRDGDRSNNVWYNLILMFESQHSKVHHPKEDFNALCRCGSRNVYGIYRQNNKQHFQCKDCIEQWSIPISEVQIMLRDRKIIKNPRISPESLGLKCLYCNSIDIRRMGIHRGKQGIGCNTCNKYSTIPKLGSDIKHRLSKRNKKLVLPTVLPIEPVACVANVLQLD